MGDVNYYRTLIAVAEDCPVSQSVVPEPRGGKATVASLQYEVLAERPYAYTQADVLFLTWLKRQDFPEAPSEAEVAKLREAFFAKPQACMRTSPLPKKYGWGLLCDEAGKVALCPKESEEYQRLTAGKAGDVKVINAMRSSRA